MDTTERLPFHFSLSYIGEGNGNPLQCSCLDNPRDRGAWWASIYGVTQSRTRLKRLSSSSSRTVAYQSPPSMGFSRQECWSGLPFPSPGDLPDPGIETRSPALQADALPSEPPENATKGLDGHLFFLPQTCTSSHLLSHKPGWLCPQSRWSGSFFLLARFDTH